jgi:hypothetical protein
MDGLVGVVAGTVSPVEFFSPDNIGHIMQAAARQEAAASGPRRA